MQRNQTGQSDLPILEVSLRTGVRVRDFDASNRKQVMSDKEKYKRARAGDIAYNMMRLWQGAVGVAPVEGLVSPAYVVAQALTGTDPRFYEYLFRTDAYMNEVNKFSRGIVPDRNRLYWEDFKQMPSPFPPRDEQAAIVHFLAHVDRRIRRYIRAKQKLIKLLEEQKQAIIHRAITRGLDPSVRLKPSGVDWLGDVPEHWEVVRLKEVTTRLEQGWSPQCDAQPAGRGEWGVLKVGCVNRDTFDPNQNKKLPPALDPVSDLEVRDGDILVSRANTRELLGLAAVALKPREKLLLCDKLFRFRAQPNKSEARFLVLAIRGRRSRAQIECSTNGASDSMQNIGQAVLRNLQLALPPIDEQRRVVAFADAETTLLVATIDRACREVELVREYRTRLIADAVTGRLDVREAAARLPAEPEEAEWLADDDAPVEGESEGSDEDLDPVSEEAEA
ncbi:MAG: hypothetical protein ACRDUX_35555 [Mycobacterium sp.]